MKYLAAIFLLFFASTCLAMLPDTLVQRHQITISMTNGLSQQFFGGMHKKVTNATLHDPTGLIFYYLPMYAMQFQLGYSVGISRYFRIETGLGYLLGGSLIKERSVDPTSPSVDLAIYRYEGALTIPVHVKFAKFFSKGVFTTSFGPDFTLPVHTFFPQNSGYFDGQTVPSNNGHIRYSRIDIKSNACMGLYLKMGYEWRFSGKVLSAINIGPVVDFYRIASFGRPYSYSSFDDYKSFQFYTGLDVALIFPTRNRHIK